MNKKMLIVLMSVIALILVGFAFLVYRVYLPIRPAISPPVGSVIDIVHDDSSSQDIGQRELVSLDSGDQFPLFAFDNAEVSLFAQGLDDARLMVVDGDGVVFLSQPDEGRVVALPDYDSDYVSDERVIVAQGLDRVHGLAFVTIDVSGEQARAKREFHIALLPMPTTEPPEEFDDNDDTSVISPSRRFQEYLYIAESGRVVRVPRIDGLVFGSPEVIINNLPAGGRHWTRSLLVRDGKLYVATGSSCNVCDEDDEHRAAIWEYDLDGSNGRMYASGIRNAVGLTLHPDTGDIWVTENGRDLLGDDIPPDEINIVREGSDYGWPYCYGDRVVDAFGGDPQRCQRSEPSYIDLPAHVAPLGLTFYTGDMFPEYRGDLFVALHGSWNRSVPVGYKVVRIDGESSEIMDFISGWLIKKSTVGVASYSSFGRPVDVVQGENGELYVSDDKAGVVYVVTKRR